MNVNKYTNEQNKVPQKTFLVQEAIPECIIHVMHSLGKLGSFQRNYWERGDHWTESHGGSGHKGWTLGRGPSEVIVPTGWLKTANSNRQPFSQALCPSSKAIVLILTLNELEIRKVKAGCTSLSGQGQLCSSATPVICQWRAQKQRQKSLLNSTALKCLHTPHCRIERRRIPWTSSSLPSLPFSFSGVRNWNFSIQNFSFFWYLVS